MRKEVFICDECGSERKDTNHWFSAYEDKNLAFFPFNAREPTMQNEKHICGQACAQKVLDRWMSTGKI